MSIPVLEVGLTTLVALDQGPVGLGLFRPMVVCTLLLEPYPVSDDAEGPLRKAVCLLRRPPVMLGGTPQTQEETSFLMSMCGGTLIASSKGVTFLPPFHYSLILM